MKIMDALIPYAAKVVMISTIMYGYYLLALRDKKFHRFNRFYLLSAVVLPVLLPLISFRFLFLVQDDVLPSYIGRDMVMDSIVISPAPESFWNISNLLSVIYLLTAIVLIILFLASLIRIYRLSKRSKVVRTHGIVLVNTNADGTPFSFFNHVFWNPDLDMRSKDGIRMFQHELAHCRQWHSADKVLTRIVCSIFWFNPFFWMIKNEIHLVHEFLADKISFQSDSASFSKIILEGIYPGYSWSLANSFFYSPVKRRIMMLLKNNHRKVNYLGRLMVLPLAVGLFIFFTMKASASQDATDISMAGSDTIPVSEIKSVEIKQMVEVTDKNGNKETMTIEDAKKAGIPVPSTVPQNLLESKSIPGDALFILNGKEISREAMNDLSPDQILSVSVLKNESAVAKYGEQGRDGVIEIVTKDANLKSGSADKVFTKVEKEAQFPGGTSAWTKYMVRRIQENLDKFTDEDFGTCVIRFIVDVNGNVSAVTAVTMRETRLAEIAADAISNGPKWIPAQQNGKNVTAYRLQPVTLRNPKLSDEVSLLDCDTCKTFTKVEKTAQFPGGTGAWSKYLQRVLTSHLNEFGKNDYGTCVLRFVVNTKGNISNVEATTMQGTKLAEVAINAVSKGPRWIPAQQNGKYVNSYRLLPVTLARLTVSSDTDGDRMIQYPMAAPVGILGYFFS